MSDFLCQWNWRNTHLRCDQWKLMSFQINEWSPFLSVWILHESIFLDVKLYEDFLLSYQIKWSAFLLVWILYELNFFSWQPHVIFHRNCAYSGYNIAFCWLHWWVGFGSQSYRKSTADPVIKLGQPCELMPMYHWDGGNSSICGIRLATSSLQITWHLFQCKKSQYGKMNECMNKKYRQSIYCLHQCWPSSLLPYGIMGPQWVKNLESLIETPPTVKRGNFGRWGNFGQYKTFILSNIFCHLKNNLVVNMEVKGYSQSAICFKGSFIRLDPMMS